MTHTITIKNETFVLHPSGSIFWEAQQMLMIADVHLGKVSHFRKAGFAVPAASVTRNFEELNTVIGYFRPEKICFLGDLFHSELNNEWLLFEKWAKSVSQKIILIAGNHDIISPQKYIAIDIAVVRDMAAGEFYLSHHPKEKEGFFNFCGHIHPAVRLRGKGRQFLTLSCFFHKPMQMILPAFGQFTGTYEMMPREEDCVYAVTKDEVIVVCG